MDAWPAWMRLLVAVLATWRVSHLIVDEDGPWDVVVRLRRRAGSGMLGRLMDCFYCTSLWVAAPCALVVTDAPMAWLICWLAISGAACLLERATRGDREGTGLGTPHQEDTHGMLREPPPPGHAVFDDHPVSDATAGAVGGGESDGRPAVRR